MTPRRSSAGRTPLHLRLRHLTYFVAIAERGQFAGAARSLGVAQPALSQAIAQLEAQVGVKLLDRHARGVTLTRAGERLYAKAHVALCFSPTPDPQVQAYTLRVEPRVLMAADTHPLATRRELSVAEVLDETFPGYHPSIDQRWVAYWRLDDYRSDTPARVTADRALNPQEVAAIIVSGRAVSTAPASAAVGILPSLRRVVTIRLSDASPTALKLIWRPDNSNPLVEALVAAADQASPDLP